MRFGLLISMFSLMIICGVLAGGFYAQSSESGSADQRCLSVSQKAAWEKAKSDAGPSIGSQPILNSMTTDIRPQAIDGAPVQAVRVSFALQNHANRTYEIHTQKDETKSICAVARISTIQ